MSIVRVHKFTCVSDTKVHTAECGVGPVIILFASMLILERSYRNLASTLAAEGFRVIVVEGPGSGRSSPVALPWTFEDYAAWFVTFLETLNERPRLAIGHSSSGAPLLLAAAQRPDCFDALILCDSVGARHPRSVVHTLFSRLCDACMEGRLSIALTPHVLHNALCHTRNFLNQIWLAARSDLTRGGTRLAPPVLLAWGRRDLTMPLGCAARLKLAFHTRGIVVSATGSHDWILTHHEAFARLVLGYLRHSFPRQAQGERMRRDPRAEAGSRSDRDASSDGRHALREAT